MRISNYDVANATSADTTVVFVTGSAADGVVTGRKALCPATRQDREGIMLPMAGHTTSTSSVIMYVGALCPVGIAPHYHCVCTMYKCFALSILLVFWGLRPSRSRRGALTRPCAP